MAPKAGNLRLTCNLCALFLKNKFLYPLNLVKYENLFFSAALITRMSQVQILLPQPRRSKLYIACSDLFYKSERAHAAAPPFQIEPAALGLDLVFSFFGHISSISPLVP